MSKTKEYSSDVQQKIAEHHKTESGCKIENPHFDNQGQN